MSFQRPVDVRMYGDARFRRLSGPQPNAQSLWIHLLTGRHTTQVAGYWAYGVGYLVDVFGWQPGDIVACFKEIEQAEMAFADWTAGAVLVPGVLKYWKPGASNIAGWRAAFDLVPESELADRWMENCVAWCACAGEDRLDAFLSTFPEGERFATSSPGGATPPGGDRGADPGPTPHTITITHTESREPSDSKLEPDHPARALAMQLRDRILQNNPKARVPKNLTEWALEIDRMMRLDGRSVEEVRDIINWCQKDEFWHRNILSAGKLRKQFDKLWLAAHPARSRERTEEDELKRKRLAEKKRSLSQIVQYSGDGVEAQILACPSWMHQELRDHVEELRRLGG